MNEPSDKPPASQSPGGEDAPTSTTEGAAAGDSAAPPPRVRRIVRSASTRAAEAAQREADVAAAEAAAKAAPAPAATAAKPADAPAATSASASASASAEGPRPSGGDASSAGPSSAGPSSAGPASGPPRAGPGARPTRDWRAPRQAGPPGGRDRQFGGPRRGPRVDESAPRRPGMAPASFLAATGQAPERPEGGFRRGPGGGPPREGRRDDRGDRPPRDRAPGGAPGGAPAGAPGDRDRRPRDARPEGPRSDRGERRPAEARAGAPISARPVVPAAPPSQPRKPPQQVHLYIPPPKAVATRAENKPAPTAKEVLAAKSKAFAAPAPSKKPEPAAPPPQAELDAAQLAAGWNDADEAARKAGPAASALVDAWVAAGNITAVAALADSERADGGARKAAKRALNVLRARGVAIPERPRAARPREEAQLEATFLPPDSSGTSSVSITSRDSSGRYHIAEVIFREPVGVLHAGSAWVSGSQIKEGKNRALESLGVAPVAVPLDWARHRVAAARALNAESKRILPLGLDACRELVEPAPAQAPPHPVADLDAAADSKPAPEASQNLHEHPEFRAWLPDRRAIEELLQKLGENLGAEGLKDPEKVNAALGEEISAATDRFFSPEMREDMARRMRDSAISVRARRGDEMACEVLATARAVREAGLITSPPRDIGFLSAFFQKAIGVLAQQGGGSLRIPVPGPGAAPSGAATESSDDESAG